MFNRELQCFEFKSGKCINNTTKHYDHVEFDLDFWKEVDETGFATLDWSDFNGSKYIFLDVTGLS